MHPDGTGVALKTSVNIFDAIIIYFACGAPFGVYYFLMNRDRLPAGRLTLRSLLEWIIWPASAVKMIGRTNFVAGRTKANFDSLPELDAETDEKVGEIQKSLEQMFYRDGAASKISIYMFREVFDRYAGLSLALGVMDKAEETPEAAIFRLANHRDVTLASICLKRRNRSLLVAHHKQAREDFIDTVDRLAESAKERTDTWISINELAVILDDIEAIVAIDKIFTGTSQTQSAGRVKEKGDVLWKPEKRRHLPSDQPILNRQPATATLKLAKED